MQPQQRLGKLGLALLLGAHCLALGRAQNQAPPAAPAPSRAPDVIFIATPPAIVEAMLKAANVQKNEVVYDLGCGDGRIVIAAAKRYGARGVGVDIDPRRIRESNENARKAGVEDRVRFVQQDLFETDFKDADVVMLFLLPELNRKLRPKLLRELRPGTRIVSHAFDMGDWKPDKIVRAWAVHYWVIPADVAGGWLWSLPGPAGDEHCRLQLTQTYQNIAGTLQIGSQTLPLATATLIGDQLSVTVVREEQKQTVTLRLNGRVRGDRLEGTWEQGGPLAGKRPWTATRNNATKPAGG